MCLLESANALFDEFKSTKRFRCLHLRQIAPTEITTTIKSFSILEACRKSAECQSKENDETA